MGTWAGAWRAATAYLLVGSLAGVNAAIPDYPVFGAQALRYTLASAVLATACLLQRRRGLLLAFGALAAEICFTLVAVPLLPRFGPLRLSAYVSALSVPVLYAFSFATGGRGALPVPTAGEAAPICYLAVAVGAGGFYFLYSALPRLGADRVGLYAGLVPFGAMGAAAVLGAGTIVPADIAGAVLVAAGVATGASTVTMWHRCGYNRIYATSLRPSQRRAAPPGLRSEERATREGGA